MSLNITVNGKFCRNREYRPSILDDPVLVKKKMECELRKQRLQEVREESKKLAAKIRNDVAAEESRQLRNLEAMKAQELDQWRRQVLAQKTQDYRSAIFQVGNAHRAAREENTQIAAKQRAQAERRKVFNTELKERITKTPKKSGKVTLQTVGVQTPKLLMKEKKLKQKKKKEKKEVCPKYISESSASESESSEEVARDKSYRNSTVCSSATESDEDLCSRVASCPCTTSNSSSSSTDEGDKRDPPSPKTSKLSKNPPIIVDIDVCSDDSVTITGGETKDQHAGSIRHFAHIVYNKSPRNEDAVQVKPTFSKPRFTQISNLIKNKQLPPPAPPPSLAAASNLTKSPHKSNTSTKSSGTSVAISAETVTLDSISNSVRPTSSDKQSSDSKPGVVNFYDYNNKYTKEYAPPVVVHEVSRQTADPNAMEQAYAERQQQALRQQDEERRRARCEERGRKALEREQVRRDCIELTQRLELLTKQYPHLLNPTDVKLQTNFYHENKAKTLEKKRSEFVEEMMLKPSIITCPEVRSPLHEENGKRREANAFGDLNLGAPNMNEQCNSASSDSCCSILLGYVDEQTNQIRRDLSQYGTDPSKNNNKAERLKTLLRRIGDLRHALCDELKKPTNSALAGNSMQEVINEVSDVRKERERIVVGDVLNDGRESPLHKHMKEVKRKEAVLEEKLRQLCDMQKKESKAMRKKISIDDDAEKICKVQTDGSNPLEIIIKVRDEIGRSKSKSKTSKSPRKVSSLIEHPAHKLMKKKSLTNGRQSQQMQRNRKNSYDSNSTAYHSLPSKITLPVDTIVEKMEDAYNGDDDDRNFQQAEIDVEPKGGHQTAAVKQPGRLNPLIVHYIQRLLGMSRYSVQELGISSSEIDTPSSSIVRTPNNLPLLTQEQIMSPERLERVQQFIDDNRSFINELEDSIRSQHKVSLEESMQVFEEIWQERLRKNQQNFDKPAKNRQVQKTAAPTRRKEEIAEGQYVRSITPSVNPRNGQKRVSRTGSFDMQNVETTTLPQRGRHFAAEENRGLEASRKKPVKTLRSDNSREFYAQPQRDNRIESSVEVVANQKEKHQPNYNEDVAVPHKSIQHAPKNSTKIVEAQSSEITIHDGEMVATEVAPSSITEQQMKHYEKLTENCTLRIAELTELIQKVREEKKRLVEVTLSSVSEGRNSTEYIDLPDGQRNRHPSDSSTEKNISSSISSASGSSTSVTNAFVPPNLLSPLTNRHQHVPVTSGDVQFGADSVPLEKHKATGFSRDSGISMSRPMTAQELEPPSQTSTVTQSSSQRKPRPPPSIQRYSPLLIEDEVAHELSTILEVDTPVTSRVASTNKRLRPVQFPTFEEYARELNLDVTHLDGDTSVRMRHEYDQLIDNLRTAQREDVPHYEEFPSLTAYLHNLTSDREGAEQCQSPETIDELLDCLRLANISIKLFPSRREYMGKLTTNSPNTEMIDSASLENIIDTNINTETESESINIEEELRRRNLLKQSFATSKEKKQFFTSTANDGTKIRAYKRSFSESGVEQLSNTSPDNLSGDMEKDLRSVGINWPTTMRRRTKEAEAQSSSTTSPELHHRRRQAQQQQSPQKTVPITQSDAAHATDTEVPQNHDEATMPTVEKRIDRNSSSGGSGTNTPPHSSAQHDRSEAGSAVATDSSYKKNLSKRSGTEDDNLFSDGGRRMNLRDFLTKELLKHCSTSSSCSSEDSMRSQFLQSIVNSMTPQNNFESYQRERQKTSTPVTISAQSHSNSSRRTSSSSPTHLFSGESRISSVHFREHSITRIYEPELANLIDTEHSKKQSVANTKQHRKK